MSLKIWLTIAIVVIILLLIHVYRQRKSLAAFVAANNKFAEVEIKLNREVYDLKKDVKAAEDAFDGEKLRANFLGRQATEATDSAFNQRKENKKLETNNKQLRTKLKRANAVIKKLDPNWFKRKRGVK